MSTKDQMDEIIFAQIREVIDRYLERSKKIDEMVQLIRSSRGTTISLPPNPLTRNEFM